MVDSGVRSGLDVVRAVALGADAAFVGKAVLWGLAAQAHLARRSNNGSNIRPISTPSGPQRSRKRVPKPDRRRALELLASCREGRMEARQKRIEQLNFREQKVLRQEERTMKKIPFLLAAQLLMANVAN